MVEIGCLMLVLHIAEAIHAKLTASNLKRRVSAESDESIPSHHNNTDYVNVNGIGSPEDNCNGDKISHHDDVCSGVRLVNDSAPARRLVGTKHGE